MELGSVLSMTSKVQKSESVRIQKAIKVAVKYGGIDGEHHKNWVIDQMVRILAGNKYEKIVKDACNGEDGPNTYEWDCGITP